MISGRVVPPPPPPLADESTSKSANPSSSTASSSAQKPVAPHKPAPPAAGSSSGAVYSDSGYGAVRQLEQWLESEARLLVEGGKALQAPESWEKWARNEKAYLADDRSGVKRYKATLLSDPSLLRQYKERIARDINEKRETYNKRKELPHLPKMDPLRAPPPSASPAASPPTQKTKAKPSLAAAASTGAAPTKDPRRKPSTQVAWTRPPAEMARSKSRESSSSTSRSREGEKRSNDGAKGSRDGEKRLDKVKGNAREVGLVEEKRALETEGKSRKRVADEAREQGQKKKKKSVEVILLEDTPPPEDPPAPSPLSSTVSPVAPPPAQLPPSPATSRPSSRAPSRAPSLPPPPVPSTCSARPIIPPPPSAQPQTSAPSLPSAEQPFFLSRPRPAAPPAAQQRLQPDLAALAAGKPQQIKHVRHLVSPFAVGEVVPETPAAWGAVQDADEEGEDEIERQDGARGRAAQPPHRSELAKDTQPTPAPPPSTSSRPRPPIPPFPSASTSTCVQSSSVQPPVPPSPPPFAKSVPAGPLTGGIACLLEAYTVLRRRPGRTAAEAKRECIAVFAVGLGPSSDGTSATAERIALAVDAIEAECVRQEKEGEEIEEEEWLRRVKVVGALAARLSAVRKGRDKEGIVATAPLVTEEEQDKQAAKDEQEKQDEAIRRLQAGTARPSLRLPPAPSAHSAAHSDGPASRTSAAEATPLAPLGIPPAAPSRSASPRAGAAPVPSGSAAPGLERRLPQETMLPAPRFAQAARSAVDLERDDAEQLWESQRKAALQGRPTLQQREEQARRGAQLQAQAQAQARAAAKKTIEGGGLVPQTAEQIRRRTSSAGSSTESSAPAHHAAPPLQSPLPAALPSPTLVAPRGFLEALFLLREQNVLRPSSIDTPSPAVIARTAFASRFRTAGFTAEAVARYIKEVEAHLEREEQTGGVSSGIRAQRMAIGRQIEAEIRAEQEAKAAASAHTPVVPPPSPAAPETIPSAVRVLFPSLATARPTQASAAAPAVASPEPRTLPPGFLAVYAFLRARSLAQSAPYSPSRNAVLALHLFTGRLPACGWKDEEEPLQAVAEVEKQLEREEAGGLLSSEEKQRRESEAMMVMQELQKEGEGPKAAASPPAIDAHVAGVAAPASRSPAQPAVTLDSSPAPPPAASSSAIKEAPSKLPASAGRNAPVGLSSVYYALRQRGVEDRMQRTLAIFHFRLEAASYGEDDRRALIAELEAWFSVEDQLGGVSAETGQARFTLAEQVYKAIMAERAAAEQTGRVAQTRREQAETRTGVVAHVAAGSSPAEQTGLQDGPARAVGELATVPRRSPLKRIVVKTRTCSRCSADGGDCDGADPCSRCVNAGVFHLCTYDEDDSESEDEPAPVAAAAAPPTGTSLAQIEQQRQLVQAELDKRQHYSQDTRSRSTSASGVYAAYAPISQAHPAAPAADRIRFVHCYAAQAGSPPAGSRPTFGASAAPQACPGAQQYHVGAPTTAATSTASTLPAYTSPSATQKAFSPSSYPYQQPVQHFAEAAPLSQTWPAHQRSGSYPTPPPKTPTGGASGSVHQPVPYQQPYQQYPPQYVPQPAATAQDGFSSYPAQPSPVAPQQYPAADAYTTATAVFRQQQLQQQELAQQHAQWAQRGVVVPRASQLAQPILPFDAASLQAFLDVHGLHLAPN
ncbi:hypothetical protein JCM10213v2_000644 [Rhodosporidiobolus nylandii]